MIISDKPKPVKKTDKHITKQTNKWKKKKHYNDIFYKENR